jgi:DNA-binding response OmpR family regulator
MKITRILVIDDDPHVSGAVRFALAQRGPFHVRTESDLTRAVLTARSYRPDLIVLAVDPPWKDGCDVAMEIGFDPVLRSVPVVRSSSQVHEKETAFRDGVPFLAKPLDLNRLTEVITRALTQHAGLCSVS